MDFLRSNVLRRGDSSSGQEQGAERGAEQDVERQQEVGTPAEQGQTRPRRFPLSRPQLPDVLTGRRNEGRRLQRRNTNDTEEDEGPKTPRINIGLPSLPSTRLHLPNLTRTWTRGESGPLSPPAGEPPQHPSEAQPRPSLQRVRAERFPVVAEPRPTLTRVDSGSSGSGGRRFRGADPAEMHLADLADRGRRRRRRRGDSDGSERPERNGRPRKFMFCFPWIKNRRVRSQVLRCFVSGMFLLTLLSVYLALSITKNINNSEFTILLILIILFTTIFFCHGLIRLCMLVLRPKSSDDEARARLPEMFGPGGYAIPRRPIRVLLARDEEAAGMESETTKVQPPAYGLWRESVRVDPNRIYWQRNEQPPTIDEAGESSTRPATANRPPSYISEDGVDYVVEARPRSMAPLTDVPLPPHPSEMNRIAPRPTW